MSTILQAIANDKNIIAYRRELNSITGSVTATILLQQLIYWANIKEWQDFYKFKEPCKNKLYKKGDSWTEELGFTRWEFDGALKKIAVKITKGVSLNKEFKNNLVVYWTDNNRLTWYKVNKRLLERKVDEIYKDQLLYKEEQPLYIEKNKTDFIYNTETTTETTYNNINNGFLEKEIENQKKDITNNNGLPSGVSKSGITSYVEYSDFSSNLGTNTNTPFYIEDDSLGSYAYIKYMALYQEKFKKAHPKLTDEEIQGRLQLLNDYSEERKLDEDEWEEIIDGILETEFKPKARYNFKKPDYNIKFISWKMLENKFNERVAHCLR